VVDPLSGLRLLFTFVGGSGHFDPLVPIARAAEAIGHSVAFGCGSSAVSLVQDAGFTSFAMGPEASPAPKRIPLRAVDPEREDRDLRERFAHRAARHRVPLVISLCSEWRPDVLVCDEMDFGAVIAAERMELPFATVLVSAAGSFVRSEVVGEALNEVRAQHDLPPDPQLEMLNRYLVLSPCPPSYRDPGHPLPPTGHSFRPSLPGSVPGSLSGSAGVRAPDWSSLVPGEATVYFTLGTIFNMESGDLFERVIVGLRDLPINLIVTVGRHIDPSEFGPQPSNVQIERHIPQSLVLPHCDLVVSHGGSGSVIGALAGGLPSLLIPMGADQPQNAERCSQLGVARVLDVAVTPETVRVAAAEMLDDPAYRRNAERLRDEIAALPEPAHAVRLLERLASDKRPLYSA